MSRLETAVRVFFWLVGMSLVAYAVVQLTIGQALLLVSGMVIAFLSMAWVRKKDRKKGKQDD
jgi:Flp pilus assembly protein TadB